MHYIPNTHSDREAMLQAMGVNSISDLLEAIPEELRLKKPLDIAPGKSEWEVRNYLSGISENNLSAKRFTSFLGAGSYDHFIPSAVDAVTSRSEFVTAYTPYQPEVSQGTLQVIYEFQSMICELFAMEAANASLYDGGTALAEAVKLAAGHNGRKRIVWFESVHPHYRKVAETINVPSGIGFDTVSAENGKSSLTGLEKVLSDETAAVVLQYPNFFGIVEDPRAVIERAHQAGALGIVAADPTAMGVLEPPGRLGADIVIAEGQPLGNPQAYGGPYLGLFAVKEELVRGVPGRIAGVTTDVDGRRGFVLTLQTREQHIRRDRATSNICTNEGLMAARATVYLSLIGPDGLREVGEECMRRCEYLREKLAKIPEVKLPFEGPYFKEFVLNVPGDTGEFLKFMASRNILPGIPLKRFHIDLDDLLLVAVTECRTVKEMDNYVEAVTDYVKQLP